MKPIIIFLLFINIILPVLCVELKSLQNLIQFITGSDSVVESKKKDLIVPNGKSNLKEYLFFTNICYYYESGSYVENKKLKVKCIPANGNGSLFLLNGLNDVMNLLTPTAKETPGNCVILLFYTRACASCTYAPHFNALSRHLTDIKVYFYIS